MTEQEVGELINGMAGLFSHSARTPVRGADRACPLPAQLRGRVRLEAI